MNEVFGLALPTVFVLVDKPSTDHRVASEREADEAGFSGHHDDRPRVIRGLHQWSVKINRHDFVVQAVESQSKEDPAVQPREHEFAGEVRKQGTCRISRSRSAPVEVPAASLVRG